MAKLVRTAEKTAWAMVGLAFLLFLIFFTLYILSKAPGVGGLAQPVGTHLSGSAYGF